MLTKDESSNLKKFIVNSLELNVEPFNYAGIFTAFLYLNSFCSCDVKAEPCYRLMLNNQSTPVDVDSIESVLMSKEPEKLPQIKPLIRGLADNTTDPRDTIKLREAIVEDIRVYLHKLKAVLKEKLEQLSSKEPKKPYYAAMMCEMERPSRIAKAIELYESVIEKDVNAQVRYAGWLASGWEETDGRVIPKNIPLAVIYYRLAANQGHALAQGGYALYLMRGYDQYETTKKIPPNIPLAVAYYRLAADQGHAIAQYNYASLLETGYTTTRRKKTVKIPPNISLAMKYYNLAALQKNVWAAYRYALLIEYGGWWDDENKHVTQPNITEARKLFSDDLLRNYLPAIYRKIAYIIAYDLLKIKDNNQLESIVKRIESLSFQQPLKQKEEALTLGGGRTISQNESNVCRASFFKEPSNIIGSSSPEFSQPSNKRKLPFISSLEINKYLKI